MINIIREIFSANNFKPTECASGTIFSLPKSNAQTSFWLVIEQDDLGSFLQNQGQIFEDCKKTITDDALDKNLSVLILHNTTQEKIQNSLKSKILQIEENPYFFKKHVLYFTSPELTMLHNAAPVFSMDFLETQIAAKNSFTYYKKNLTLETWQSLAYRIAIKLPFVKLRLGFSGGLEDLSSKNRHSLYEAKQASFSDNFMQLMSTKSIDEIKTIDATELLNHLTIALEI